MALSPQEKQRLKDIARELRLTVIDVMAWSGGAHVGGSLSIIDSLETDRAKKTIANRRMSGPLPRAWERPFVFSGQNMR